MHIRGLRIALGARRDAGGMAVSRWRHACSTSEARRAQPAAAGRDGDGRPDLHPQHQRLTLAPEGRRSTPRSHAPAGPSTTCPCASPMAENPSGAPGVSCCSPAQQAWRAWARSASDSFSQATPWPPASGAAPARTRREWQTPPSSRRRHDRIPRPSADAAPPVGQRTRRRARPGDAVGPLTGRSSRMAAGPRQPAAARAEDMRAADGAGLAGPARNAAHAEVAEPGRDPDTAGHCGRQET